jgi:hypothetical protein
MAWMMASPSSSTTTPTSTTCVDDVAAAYRQAESVIARYDRPLHRRKHEIDLADAARDVRRLPGLIEDARNEANNAACRIEQIRLSSTQAAEVLKRRPFR